MPYLVKGSVEQIFHAFGQDWAITEGSNDEGHIKLDVPRCDFLGTKAHAKAHFNIWKHALGNYYLQGNMSAGNLQYLLGPNPLMKEKEEPESYHLNFIRQHFAYMNHQGESCGLMVMYRKDNPKQWIMGLTKKNHAAPKDRELVFLSSIDLAPFIQSHSEIRSLSVEHPDNPLIKETDSDLLTGLLKNSVDKNTGDINLRFQRVELLTRKLTIDQETATIDDPVCFSELDLSALFADNRALDLLIQYQIPKEFHLSSVLLNDLLSESGQLRQEIEKIQFTDDEIVNKNLLKLSLVLFEHGVLEKNRSLLQNLAFVKTFGSFIEDELQIKLIPFLKQRHIDEDLIRLILSDEAYYKSLDVLLELNPAFAQDVPELFKGPKRDELKFIHQVMNEECKKLCLIFWVKGNLSEDGYQSLVAETQKYPLLASTLVDLDKTQNIEINKLQDRALTPKIHLYDSILYHFDNELKNLSNTKALLRRLNIKDLESTILALILLKKSNITDPKKYQLVLDNEKKGQSLRLLLPQLMHIKNEDHRKSMIDVLYKGVLYGTQIQRNTMLEIKAAEQLALAECLRERFICVTQMQQLELNREMIELAAQEDTEESQFFRQVILRVEAQCKVVFERLSRSVSYREMLLKWADEEKNYRKTLYCIAYDKLTNPDINIQEKLKSAEKKILDVVDPEIDSAVYHALIVIANIIISVFTLGIANKVKHYKTGNPWFFNQTASGEELRALDNDVLELIEPEL